MAEAKSALSFSLIIPVYNRPDEVRELLQSLLEQSRKDFEIVIVEEVFAWVLGRFRACKILAVENCPRMEFSY